MARTGRPRWSKSSLPEHRLVALVLEALASPYKYPPRLYASELPSTRTDEVASAGDEQSIRSAQSGRPRKVVYTVPTDPVRFFWRAFRIARRVYPSRCDGAGAAREIQAAWALVNVDPVERVRDVVDRMLVDPDCEFPLEEQIRARIYEPALAVLEKLGHHTTEGNLRKIRYRLRHGDRVLRESLKFERSSTFF